MILGKYHIVAYLDPWETGSCSGLFGLALIRSSQRTAPRCLAGRCPLLWRSTAIGLQVSLGALLEGARIHCMMKGACLLKVGV